MDPTPFHHRDLDLDTDAKKFLESWALEFPQVCHFRIIVHIEKMPLEDPAPLVAEAICNHFEEYKSVLAKRTLRLLLLEVRTSLLIGIGIGFLALCLIAADLLSSFANNTFHKLLKESLLIGGWVAMWSTLQIFLYVWWPIVRKIRIYRNLGAASVHIAAAFNVGSELATNREVVRLFRASCSVL